MDLSVDFYFFSLVKNSSICDLWIDIDIREWRSGFPVEKKQKTLNSAIKIVLPFYQLIITSQIVCAGTKSPVSFCDLNLALMTLILKFKQDVLSIYHHKMPEVSMSTYWKQTFE